jgi:hypothetical protein
LRAATFLRELFFLVFFLMAMPQVYHCGPAQFILAALNTATISFANRRIRCRVMTGSRR